MRRRCYKHCTPDGVRKPLCVDGAINIALSPDGVRKPLCVDDAISNALLTECGILYSSAGSINNALLTECDRI